MSSASARQPGGWKSSATGPRRRHPRACRHRRQHTDTAAAPSSSALRRGFAAALCWGCLCAPSCACARSRFKAKHDEVCPLAVKELQRAPEYTLSFLLFPPEHRKALMHETGTLEMNQKLARGMHYRSLIRGALAKFEKTLKCRVTARIKSQWKRLKKKTSNSLPESKTS